MNRLEAIAVVAIVIVATWVVATALPAWSEVAWAAGIFLILAVGLLALVGRAGAMRHPGPSPFGRLLTNPDRIPVRPADLERIERLAGWVAYSQHDFSHRLQPLIVDLVRRRLNLSKGMEFADGELPDPDLLTPGLAALVRPPEASKAPITTADLSRALDEIETL